MLKDDRLGHSSTWCSRGLFRILKVCKEEIHQVPLQQLCEHIRPAQASVNFIARVKLHVVFKLTKRAEATCHAESL